MLSAAIVVLVALSIRLIYYWQVRGSPLFRFPQIDAKAYDLLAQEFAKGNLLSPHGQPYWQPPFYPLFLAVIYAIFGHSLVAVRIVQFALGALSCLLIYLTAFRRFGQRAALLAGLFCATNASLIYYEGELLTPSLTIFLNLMVIWLLTLYEDDPRPWRLGLAGVLLGLSGITRPDVLLFSPAVLVWLILQRRPDLMLAVALFAVGVAFPIAVVTTRNYIVSREPVLISWNGGINFYIGNSKYSDRMQMLRPGPDWNWLEAMPVREGYIAGSARSAYFYRKAFSEIRSNPILFAKLFVKKAIVFWNAREIRRNHDDYYNRRVSLLYRILLWKNGRFGFPFGILGPLSLLGMVLYLRRKRELVLFYGYVFSQYVAVILFFVCSRYRAPTIPILCIFAAGAVFEVARLLRQRDFYSVISSILILIPLVYISLIDNPLASENQRIVDAETYGYVGEAEMQLGNLNAAMEDLRRSVALDPKVGWTRSALTEVYVRLGMMQEARREWNAAIKLDPTLDNYNTQQQAEAKNQKE